MALPTLRSPSPALAPTSAAIPRLLIPGARPARRATTPAWFSTPKATRCRFKTDTLAATTDGQHILGAAHRRWRSRAVGHRRFDSIRTKQRRGNRRINYPGEFAIALPAVRTNTGALTINHPFPPTQQAVSGISATAINQIVPSPASNLAFITYTGSTPGATLPYYMPAEWSGRNGELRHVDRRLGGTAPFTGAFSLDDKLFFVSTAGDNLIHFINTTTLQDTQQINPNLPACTPGSDPDCPHHDARPPTRVPQLRLP